MLNIPTSTLLTAKQTLSQRGALAYISRLPARKVAIFATQRSVSQYRQIEKIVQNKKRFDARIFSPSWKGEPKLSHIKQSVSELLEFKPDWIVAIGGGSVMDGAKIAWSLYENPNLDTDQLSVAFALPELRKKARFVCVPTSAGTGSEASSSAIITSEDGSQKIPVMTHDFLPDLAILDGDLLVQIPHSILVPSMLDALSHAIEGYMSKMQNALACNLASHAIRNLLQAFRKLSQNEDFEELALMGAYFAGIVQNMNAVGPAHALAHHIPALPHGVATGLFLPEVIRIYCDKSSVLQEQYNDLAVNVGFRDIADLVSEIYKDILPMLGVNTKISEFVSLEESDFTALAHAASEDSLVRFFPEAFDKDDFIKVLSRSY